MAYLERRPTEGGGGVATLQMCWDPIKARGPFMVRRWVISIADLRDGTLNLCEKKENCQSAGALRKAGLWAAAPFALSWVWPYGLVCAGACVRSCVLACVRGSKFQSGHPYTRVADFRLPISPPRPRWVQKLGGYM